MPCRFTTTSDPLSYFHFKTYLFLPFVTALTNANLKDFMMIVQTLKGQFACFEVGLYYWLIRSEFREPSRRTDTDAK